MSMNIIFPMLLLATVSVFMSACSKPLAIVGVGAESLETAMADVKSHDIYFATTRARSSDENAYFGGNRQRNLTTGTITIGIPPKHLPGKIELAKTEEAFDPNELLPNVWTVSSVI